MEQTNTPSEREKELQRFLEFTTARDARRTLLKLFFNSEKSIRTEKDEEEVYLMYNFLDRIE